MSFESSIKSCSDRNASPISPKNKNDNEKIKGMIGRKSIWLGIDAGAWSESATKKAERRTEYNRRRGQTSFRLSCLPRNGLFERKFSKPFLKLFNPS